LDPIRFLLSQVTYDDLFSEVSELDYLSPYLQTKDVSKDELISFIFSHYKENLFYNDSIRKLILSLLDIDSLQRIAIRLNQHVREDKSDQIRTLISIKWTKTSGLIELLDDAISNQYGFNIPTEYFPESSSLYFPSIEDVISRKIPPLFDYQEAVSSKLVHFFSDDRKTIMIQMPTGSGKTRTAMHAIIKHLGSIDHNSSLLWLAHTEELCEQAIESFKDSWEAYSTGLKRLYRMFGNRKFIKSDIVNNSVIFASLQKVHNLLKNNSELLYHIRKNLNILVFDEAHKATARTYLEIINFFKNDSFKINIVGLSATPGRNAKTMTENKELSDVFDNQLIKPKFADEDNITALRKLGVLAKIKREEITGISDFEVETNDRSYMNTFYDIPIKALRSLGENKRRNDLIINKIIELSNSQINILIFACSVQHSKLLSAILNYKGISAESITSDMSSISRYKAIDRFKKNKSKVLINYGILSTGFDAPNIGAVIITRPTSSMVLYSQMIGRGLRGPKVGGREECLLIDVKDNFIGYGDQQIMYDFFDGYWE